MYESLSFRISYKALVIITVKQLFRTFEFMFDNLELQK